MSKYKVGDEVLIKAKITDIEPADYYPYVVTTLKGHRTWATESDIAEVTEDEYNRGREEALQEVQNCESYGYEKGLQDAWELALKIVAAENKGGIKDVDCQNIFGTLCGAEILRENTCSEAIAKIEAYEKEQEQIKVGDVLGHLRDFAENYKEELEQYRAIGTVEQLKTMFDGYWKLKDLCEEYVTYGLPEDYWKLNEICKEYSAIGTIEEFKAFRSDDFTQDLLNMGYTKGIKDGYNKAIDEFAEKLIERIHTVPNKCIGGANVMELAEQMKAGDEV